MNLFPQEPSLSIPSPTKDIYMLHNYRTNTNMKSENPRAQVTMIYEGKVFIFSDLSSEKAKEILHLVEDEGVSPQIYTQLNHQTTLTTPNNNTNRGASNLLENINQGSNFDASMDHMSCELPIARRNSLHRFLEKRQDRCVRRGPYHNSGNRMTAILEPRAESKWWLGLAP